MPDRAQILLRVPAGLKAQVTERAAADGLSVNAWAARALLVALGDPPAGARGLPAAQASAREMDAPTLRAALLAASNGATDATALVQEWYDRFGEAPPRGTYQVSDTIHVRARESDAPPAAGGTETLGKASE